MLRTKEEIREFEKKIDELDGEIQKYTDLHKESSSELIRLESSRQDARGRKQQEVKKLLDELPVDLSSKGAIDKIYQIKPDPGTRQLEDNIEKLETSCMLAERKRINTAGEKAKLENLIHQNEIDEVTINAFKEFEKMLDFYKVTDNHYHNVVIPAIDRAYEADSLFHDVNGRAMRLGLHKLISHAIANRLKQGATQGVSLDTVIEHIRYNFDSEGSEYMILPRVYDKDVDVDLYREHF